MPPVLRDGDTAERAALRWMTRILAALAHQSKDGTVRISRRSLDAVSDVSERQALFEDRDNRGNLVLRFGSKHSAIYPVESDGKWDQRESPKEVRIDRSQLSPNRQSTERPQDSTESQVVPPKSDAKIAQMESTIRRQQLANRIIAGAFKRERQKNQALEGILEGVPEAREPVGR